MPSGTTSARSSFSSGASGAAGGGGGGWAASGAGRGQVGALVARVRVMILPFLPLGWLTLPSPLARGLLFGAVGGPVQQLDRGLGDGFLVRLRCSRSAETWWARSKTRSPIGTRKERRCRQVAVI